MKSLFGFLPLLLAGLCFQPASADEFLADFIWKNPALHGINNGAEIEASAGARFYRVGDPTEIAVEGTFPGWDEEGKSNRVNRVLQAKLEAGYVIDGNGKRIQRMRITLSPYSYEMITDGGVFGFSPFTTRYEVNERIGLARGFQVHALTIQGGFQVKRGDLIAYTRMVMNALGYAYKSLSAQFRDPGMESDPNRNSFYLAGGEFTVGARIGLTRKIVLNIELFDMRAEVGTDFEQWDLSHQVGLMFRKNRKSKPFATTYIKTGGASFDKPHPKDIDSRNKDYLSYDYVEIGLKVSL